MLKGEMINSRWRQMINGMEIFSFCRSIDEEHEVQKQIVSGKKDYIKLVNNLCSVGLVLEV